MGGVEGVLTQGGVQRGRWEWQKGRPRGVEAVGRGWSFLSDGLGPCIPKDPSEANPAVRLPLPCTLAPLGS